MIATRHTLVSPNCRMSLLVCLCRLTASERWSYRKSPRPSSHSAVAFRAYKCDTAFRLSRTPASDTAPDTIKQVLASFMPSWSVRCLLASIIIHHQLRRLLRSHLLSIKSLTFCWPPLLHHPILLSVHQQRPDTNTGGLLFITKASCHLIPPFSVHLSLLRILVTLAASTSLLKSAFNEAYVPPAPLS